MWEVRFCCTSSGSGLRDPFFEGGGIFLADDDVFVNRQDQFHADLASFEWFESFNVVRVDDVFAVGAVKDILVQFFFEFAEVAFFRHVFAVLLVHQKYEFVLGEEIAGVFDADGLKFNSFSYQDARSFSVVAAEIVGEVILAGEVFCGDEVLVVDEMRPESLVFFDGVL